MTEYDRIRRHSFKRGELWEDPDFPITQTSIFYHQSPPFQFVWKRPKVKMYVTNLEKENRHFNFTEEGKFAFTDIFQVTKQSCVDQFLLSVGREEQSFLGYIITGQMWKWFCPFTETTFAYLNNIFHALKWTEAVWRDFSLSFRFLFTFFVVLLFSMQLACSKT